MVSFLLEHYFLSGLFTAILILLLVNEWRHRAFGVRGISTQQLVDLLNHANGQVVDIRAKEAFDRGHVVGALNIPQADFESSLNSLNKYKSKPVVVVCMQGGESPRIAKQLKDKGFDPIFYLSGGFQTWLNENLPVIQKK